MAWQRPDGQSPPPQYCPEAVWPRLSYLRPSPVVSCPMSGMLSAKCSILSKIFLTIVRKGSSPKSFSKRDIFQLWRTLPSEVMPITERRSSFLLSLARQTSMVTCRRMIRNSKVPRGLPRDSRCVPCRRLCAGHEIILHRESWPRPQCRVHMHTIISRDAINITETIFLKRLTEAP